MGNAQGIAKTPEEFVTQSKTDWDKQFSTLLKKQPTIIRSVELPPGVSLDDPRLAEGKVVSERRYELQVGEVPEWPQMQFEADIDGRLFNKNQHGSHFAVYPDEYLKEISCGRCDFHKHANPALFGAPPLHMLEPQDAVGELPLFSQKEKTEDRRFSQISTVPSIPQ